jgi:mannosyltransferase OCH1-like enzyme
MRKTPQKYTNYIINSINLINKTNAEIYKKNFEERQIYNLFLKLNIPFQLKEKYDSIIPLNLYTHWHTKDLPPLMLQNYNSLVQKNPEFKHFLFDETDSRNFIQNNFSTEVLNCFDKLVPCAYKSDLFRYCILYINGGIYVDIKYSPVNNFKFIALTEQEFFVRDIFVRDIFEKRIYNALIITLPKNEVLLKMIYQIVENVNNTFYGNNPLCPTGPELFGNFFSTTEINQFELCHKSSIIENKFSQYYIVFKNTIILQFYKNYREEQKINQKMEPYSELWKNKKIYY